MSRNPGKVNGWDVGRRSPVDVLRTQNSITPSSRHSTIPARNAGLTLIEVMLAIVILGIGAGTLLVATSRCMAVATKAQYYSTAHRLLMQVNAESPINREEIEDGVETGEFEKEEGYTWEREVLNSENEDREGLYTVRTRVIWSARGRNAFEEVVTFLYIPPKEKRADRVGED